MTHPIAGPGRSRATVWQGLAIVVLSVCLLAMPQLKYLALHQSFYDLGQYATTLFAVRMGEAGQALQGHAHLLAPPFAWATQLVPSPATLLALQSLILVGSAWLAGLVFLRTGAGSAWSGALLYLLGLSVWFNALFEFHFEHLLFPIIFAAYLAARRDDVIGRLGVVGCAVLLCFTKETYALSAVGLGLYMFAARRNYLTGLLIVAVSSAYFLYATGTLIPHYSRGMGSGEIWAGAFGGLGNTMQEILWSLVSQPVNTALRILQPRKFLYVAVLGGAFAFLWLRRPGILLVAAPILAVALLSMDPRHFYLGSQYTAGVSAPLFVATAAALGSLSARFRKPALYVVMATSLGVLIAFGPAPVSRLVLQNQTFAYGYSAFMPSDRDRWVARTVDRLVPADPRLSVSVQNNILTDQLANRRALMAFPAGVSAPYRLGRFGVLGMVESTLRPFFSQEDEAVDDIFADYVVLDAQRPLDLADSDCAFVSGSCTDASAIAAFDAQVTRLDTGYDVLFNEDGLRIYRRRP